MHSISSKWRKPKGRMSKKRMQAMARAAKRWHPNNVSEGADASPGTAETVDTSVDANAASCATATKLSALKECPQVVTKDSISTYTLMHSNVWDNLLRNVACTACNTNSLTVDIQGNFGYASKLEIVCKTCNHGHGSSFSSLRLENQRRFEVNMSMVKAFLKCGQGHAAMEKFSIALGIGSMDKKVFTSCLDSLATEGVDVRREMNFQKHGKNHGNLA